MEDNIKKDNEKEVNPKVEEKTKSETVKNEHEPIKLKIGTVGNFILAALAILIVGTGALTYYLIHTAKEDYDKQYSEIVANISNIVNETEDENVIPIGNLIDSAISDVTGQSSNTVTTDASNTRKTLNEELVVLYNGLILDTTKMDEVTLQYIDSTNKDADKYVITYYNYENYSFKDAKLGTLSTQVYEGLVKMENVGKVAISEDYEAIPRQVKVVNTIPTIISDNNDKISEFDTVKTLIVDLDGNQTDEYILVLANKTTGFSKITLFDSKGVKVADLASIEKSQWKKDTNAEYYLSISNVEVIDVDNDGIMEIMVEIPQPTGDPKVSLLKYNNGALEGKTDIKCSLISEE
ncbi:MAG TPA: hypothetical protein IAD08_07260 [Candidatus Scatovivens faecipullorum]|nr:hypothetical protein [Candidatus Scatovivens faecipullorum]